MSQNATTDSRPDEVVLNRSTVHNVQVFADYAFVVLRDEGQDTSRTLFRTTPAAARDLTPGETVEVVLRRTTEPLQPNGDTEPETRAS